MIVNFIILLLTAVNTSKKKENIIIFHKPEPLPFLRETILYYELIHIYDKMMIDKSLESTDKSNSKQAKELIKIKDFAISTCKAYRQRISNLFELYDQNCQNELNKNFDKIFKKEKLIEPSLYRFLKKSNVDPNRLVINTDKCDCKNETYKAIRTFSVDTVLECLKRANIFENFYEIIFKTKETKYLKENDKFEINSYFFYILNIFEDTKLTEILKLGIEKLNRNEIDILNINFEININEYILYYIIILKIPTSNVDKNAIECLFEKNVGNIITFLEFYRQWMTTNHDPKKDILIDFSFKGDQIELQDLIGFYFDSIRIRNNRKDKFSLLFNYLNSISLYIRNRFGGCTDMINKFQKERQVRLGISEKNEIIKTSHDFIKLIKIKYISRQKKEKRKKGCIINLI